ncbi:sugar transporter ERD6-like 9 [Zerene cesonia]|uniref:sugar transporter ERD6-like 9 n=1 Tax=Zerene cesonia TaxID=33412 RepID=UPI0018E527EA|nr:sugar transporter ERD6-like 9 [Zerene cesonia]
MAEYSDPKRRGYFTTIKKCTVAMGSLVCHSLYLTWTWRHIGLLACVPFILSTIDILLWPESPAYLAMQGRYNECRKSHKWLFGDSSKANKDLNDLISAQIRRRAKKKKTAVEIVIRFLEHKGIATFATGIVFTSLYAVTIKYVPIMMEKLGIEGMFAIFASCLLVSFIFLHFILMETKDKTLQEIEDKIKGIPNREILLGQKINEEI